jgi:hypothetical protein
VERERKEEAGPSTPLKYASLRMTRFRGGGRTKSNRAQRAPAFGSAEVRFAQDDKVCCLETDLNATLENLL